MGFRKYLFFFLILVFLPIFLIKPAKAEVKVINPGGCSNINVSSYSYSTQLITKSGCANPDSPSCKESKYQRDTKFTDVVYDDTYEIEIKFDVADYNNYNYKITVDGANVLNEHRQNLWTPDQNGVVTASIKLAPSANQLWELKEKTVTVERIGFEGLPYCSFSYTPLHGLGKSIYNKDEAFRIMGCLVDRESTEVNGKKFTPSSLLTFKISNAPYKLDGFCLPGIGCTRAEAHYLFRIKGPDNRILGYIGKNQILENSSPDFINVEPFTLIPLTNNRGEYSVQPITNWERSFGLDYQVDLLRQAVNSHDIEIGQWIPPPLPGHNWDNYRFEYKETGCTGRFSIDNEGGAAPTPVPPNESAEADQKLKESVCNALTGVNQRKCEDCVSGYGGKEKGVWTAVGCIQTNISGFINSFFTIGLGIAGGIALLFLIYGSFLVLTSQGNAEQVQQGREIITSAIAGLLLIIFSIFIFNLVANDILKIPFELQKKETEVSPVNSCEPTGNCVEIDVSSPSLTCGDSATAQSGLQCPSGTVCCVPNPTPITSECLPSQTICSNDFASICCNRDESCIPGIPPEPPKCELIPLTLSIEKLFPQNNQLARNSQIVFKVNGSTGETETTFNEVSYALLNSSGNQIFCRTLEWNSILQTSNLTTTQPLDLELGNYSLAVYDGTTCSKNISGNSGGLNFSIAPYLSVTPIPENLFEVTLLRLFPTDPNQSIPNGGVIEIKMTGPRINNSYSYTILDSQGRQTQPAFCKQINWNSSGETNFTTDPLQVNNGQYSIAVYDGINCSDNQNKQPIATHNFNIVQ